jgi:MarR family transcriptional regulator, organic hydroperoxide resistance regulator
MHASLNYKITMKAKETVCFHIKSAWHHISKIYNEQGAPYGSTAATGFVLLNIDAKEGSPVTSIGPALGMEPGSLSRILKNLEKEGLIQRIQDDADKRLVRVFLTDKGKVLRDVARETVKLFNEKVREEIPEEKLAVFFEVMEKIHNVIHKKNIYN